METVKRIYKGVAWGVVYNVINAAYGFISIPIIVGFYGKEFYGLIGLAVSINVYLQLLEMGLSSTNIRFFSTYLAKKDMKGLSRLFQSSLCVYGGIGLINGLVLIIVRLFSDSFFDFSAKKMEILDQLLIILAVSAVFNWLFSIFRQFIMATENTAWVQKWSIFPKLIQVGILIVTLKLSLSVEWYFFLRTFSILIIFPVFIYKVHKLLPGIQFLPKYSHEVFKSIIPYSISIFSFAIFHFTANKFGPLILGATTGLEAVADFRVIETIKMIIITMNGVFLTTILPVASRINATKDTSKKNRLAEDGTFFVSIFLMFMIGMLIINSESLLVIYLGEDFKYLSFWLILAAIQVLSSHTSAISSLVLAEGKFRSIIFMSFSAMLISLSFCWYFAERIHVGAAIIGIIIYYVIESVFGYVYYYPKILKLQSKKIFVHSFLRPLLLFSSLTLFILFIIDFETGNLYLDIILSSSLFIGATCLLSRYLFTGREKDILNSLLPKKLRWLVG